MKPAAFCVTHPATRAAMVFVDEARAQERAATMRAHVTKLYTAGQIAEAVERLGEAGWEPGEIAAAIRDLA